ncbi:MAG TPA: ATP-binding protein [Acetobacteraceae bacterium]
MLDAMSDAMAVLDADGACLAANQAFVMRSAPHPDEAGKRRIAFSPDGIRQWSIVSFPGEGAGNRVKSGFLAAMSHELRTPLNAVIGFGEIMHQEALGPIGAPEYRDYAGHILRSGQHLLALINERQALLNVAGNAVKFTPAGGRVSVALAPGADGGAVITVTDSGIGIADSHVANVFDVFWQADSGLDRVKAGAGIGLPLAQQLIAMHGAVLELKSRLGEGTQVTLTPPSGEDAMQRTASAARRRAVVRTTARRRAGQAGARPQSRGGNRRNDHAGTGEWQTARHLGWRMLLVPGGGLSRPARRQRGDVRLFGRACGQPEL